MAAQQQLHSAREQLRSLERQAAKEARFGERSSQVRQAESRRSLQTAEQQMRDLAQEEQRAHAEAEQA